MWDLSNPPACPGVDIWSMDSITWGPNIKTDDSSSDTMQKSKETLHGFQDDERRKNEYAYQVELTHILRYTDETNQEPISEI